MSQCPDHPHVLGAIAGNCIACAREIAPPPPDLRARVRAAIVPPPSRDADPDPTRAAAIHRARTERTKETKP